MKHNISEKNVRHVGHSKKKLAYIVLSPRRREGSEEEALFQEIITRNFTSTS